MDLVFENLKWAQKYYNQLLYEGKQTLRFLPEGSLYKKRINHRDYFYTRQEGNVRILRSKEDYLKKQLAMRCHAQAKIKLSENNYNAVSKCLEKYREYNHENICSMLPRSLVNLPKSLFLPEREESEENGVKFMEEGRIHKTGNGLMVRSRVEAIATTIFEKYNLEFEYEPEISINGKNYHPDFKILRKTDEKEIYYEHFGYMNETSYRNQTVDKILSYASGGIVLWENLIISFDSIDGKVDINMMEKVFRTFLL